MINLKPVDGTVEVRNKFPHHRFHDIAVKGNKTGTLTIRGKKIGGSVFEDIPDGVITLSAPLSIMVEGVIEYYEFTLAGVTGTDEVIVSDTSRN